MPPRGLTHVYLSPHLDDAVLACGGSLHRHTRAGARVVVVTVCAGVPPSGPLSPFAQELHARWAGDARLPASPAEMVALRRAEDLAALAHLGAEAVHLDLADCIYRRNPATGLPLYTHRAALFGDLSPAELGLVRRIAAKLTTLFQGLGRHHLHVPLAVGHHVDHQLTRRAAEAAGGVYAYYEDYPYADQLGSQWPDPGHTQAHGRPLQPELLRLTEADLAAKIAAIERYGSQISTFWTDAAGMAAAVSEFALRTGGDFPAERLWRAGAASVPSAGAASSD